MATAWQRAPRIPKGGIRAITAKALQEETGVLADHLLREHAVSDVELEAWRPGGSANPDTDATGWLKWYRLLNRRHERWIAQHERGQMQDGDDVVLLDVLRGRAEQVTCVARAHGGEDAPPISVMVYPKSFHALMEIASIDHTIAWLAAHLQRLKESERAEDLDLTARIFPSIASLYARLVWIVTTPGCGMPYDETVTDPVVPEAIMRLDAGDLFRINATHHRVNQLRLTHLTGLIAAETGNAGGERPSWAVFIGAASESLKIAPRELMRDWSLAEVLLMVRTSASVKRQAYEDAKRKTDTP